MIFPDGDPDMREDFAWSCRWTKRVSASFADKIADVATPLFHAQVRVRAIARAIVAIPGFTEAVKRGDETEAAELILLNAATRWARRYHVNKAKSLPSWPLRLFAIDDGRTCAAAVALHGRRYVQGAEPALPLPRCNVKHCRCSLHPHR